MPLDCPKCGAGVEPGEGECRQCGVIFAKYRQPHNPDRARLGGDTKAGARSARTAAEWWGQVALLVALAAWTVSFATTPFGPVLMDTVWHLPDLVFHEAGHILFIPFGQFMTALGGSLFQCALPLALAGVFLHQGNRFGAVVCVWWAGQNLVDVAPYVADARTLQLVLLGGRTGGEVEGHDWEYILTQLGWLHLDRSIGVSTYRVGLAIMMASLAAGLLIAVRQTRRAGANLGF